MENVELELYLVRHGESMGNTGAWNDKGPDKAYDPPLTEKGVRQAELLGEFFSDFPVDFIFTSGLERALYTATEVAKHQPEKGAGFIEVHKIFSECEIGEEAPGRHMEEITADFPLARPAEGSDTAEPVIVHSKGATDTEHLERGREALRYLRERFHKGERVMVVAHAAFNTFLLFAALGLSADLIFDPSFHNTGVTKIVFFGEGKGPYADVHLEYHNRVSHLVGEMPEYKF